MSQFSKNASVIVAAGTASILLSAFASAQAEAGDARLGMNLAGPADWNTELPFVDKHHALLHQANAHTRLAGIYAKHFDAWEKEGGGLFCYFSSVSRWSKWGSWGILQHYDDDPAKSPKFMATMQWARRLGQPVGLPPAASDGTSEK